MATPASFKLDLTKFADQARTNMKEFAVEVIQEVNQQVVQGTPVKTGFLRDSWYAALNSDPTAPGGSGDLGSMNVVAGSLKLGDTYNATNGAAYAMRIEFGFVGKDSLGRNYNQAPQPYVRPVIDRSDAIAQEIASRLSSAAG